MKYKYVVVGAGLSGLTVAERIANELDEKVLVIEKRRHIGGACYDCFDEYGVLVGKYGPHTFHTNDKELMDYLLKFTKWHNYTHRALSFVDGKFVPFPICKKTLEALYGDISQRNAEDVLKENEEDIINKFFRTFTYKQWGCRREELDKSVTARIPFRANDDDRYFTDKYQGNPLGGYTKMFQNMIVNPNIHVLLNTDYKDVINDVDYETLIYTGPLDYYFDYKLGKLLYRSVKFNFEHYDLDSYQPIASTRYPGFEREYTRITEFKKMTGQEIGSTTILKEIPCFGGDPFYPYPTAQYKELAGKYENLAKREKKTVFLGRLAEYKYLDMDDVLRNALDLFAKIKKKSIQ